MSLGSFQGTIRNGMILLDEPAHLVEGTRVVVTPVKTHRTGAEIVAAMESLPPIPSEWVDELVALIRERSRPARFEDPFADFPDEVEKS